MDPVKLDEIRKKRKAEPLAQLEDATATVAMDPVKLDEFRKKRKAELRAQLEDIKSELKKREERSLPGAKVTDGGPNKLSVMEKLHPFLVEAMKKKSAELREAYSKRVPPILIYRDPCCTAASPPAFSEDGEGKEA